MAIQCWQWINSCIPVIKGSGFLGHDFYLMASISAHSVTEGTEGQRPIKRPFLYAYLIKMFSNTSVTRPWELVVHFLFYRRQDVSRDDMMTAIMLFVKMVCRMPAL